MLGLITLLSLFVSNNLLQKFPVEAILCFGIPILILILINIITNLSDTRHLGKEQKKVSWQTLARIHNLNFVTENLYFAPGNLYRDGAQVIGNYRGYHLELFTLYADSGKMGYLGTRLELVALHLTTKREFDGNQQKKQPIVVHGEEVDFQEAFAHLVSVISSKSLAGELKILGYYQGIYYQQSGVVSDINLLQSLFDHLSDILDYYYALVEMGGEIVPALETMAAQKEHIPLITPLLEGVTEETAGLNHLAPELLCPHCFVSFGTHPVKLSWWRSGSYYGCRACSQSREFFRRPINIIAVLDDTWDGECSHRHGSLRVNGLAHQSLFDFDRVEIIQASDEEVERFAVQVGNDTDSVRKRHYQQITCVVRPECRLSENTLRILRHTFKAVEQRQAVE